MQISVDPDSLAADGAALIDSLTGQPPPVAEPASAHDTSVSVAANLTAQSQVLNTYINDGLQKRSAGGAAVMDTAASFRATEDGNAALIAGSGSSSGAIPAPTPVASVSDLALPGIPPILPLAPNTGEGHSVALNNGNGAGSLRALADYWQSRATTLDKIAAETSNASVGLNAHWSDSGLQKAGAKTAAHGNWWSDTATLCRALASVCNDAADQHDQAVVATPNPQEFTDANNLVAQLNAANTSGLLTSQVAEAKALVALLQSQATEAATTHHTASTATVNSTAGQGAAAPSIASGSGGTGAAASVTQNGTATANNAGALGLNASQTGSGQLVSNTGQAAAGAGSASGAGSAMQLAQLASMFAPLSMMGMGPMSALSGLGGMSRQNTPTAGMGFGSAGLTGAAAMDAGLAGDMSDTLPAASGGIDALGGAGSSLPAANASHASPTAVSGPAASVGIPAESAGTAPASAVGGAGGGMSTYPPMMGSPGAGDAGSQRNIRLFPDRRVVSRPVPNTEAVFGELERERRPRRKRAAREEGTTNDR